MFLHFGCRHHGNFKLFMSSKNKRGWIDRKYIIEGYAVSILMSSWKKNKKKKQEHVITRRITGSMPRQNVLAIKNSLFSLFSISWTFN